MNKTGYISFNKTDGRTDGFVVTKSGGSCQNLRTTPLFLVTSSKTYLLFLLTHPVTEI
jgi:hypothetical protein